MQPAASKLSFQCPEELENIFQPTDLTIMLWHQCFSEEIGPNKQQKLIACSKRYPSGCSPLASKKSKINIITIIKLATTISETLLARPREEKSWKDKLFQQVGGNYIQRLKNQTRISPQSATIDFR